MLSIKINYLSVYNNRLTKSYHKEPEIYTTDTCKYSYFDTGGNDPDGFSTVTVIML